MGMLKSVLEYRAEYRAVASHADQQQALAPAVR